MAVVLTLELVTHLFDIFRNFRGVLATIYTYYGAAFWAADFQKNTPNSVPVYPYG